MATLKEMQEAAQKKAAERAAVNAGAKEQQKQEALVAKEDHKKEVSEGNIRYFCKIAGHRFIFEDGQEAFFNYGRLDVGPKSHPGTWRQYQKELNAILGKQTTIFVPEVPPEVAPVVSQNAKSEAEIADAEQKLLAGAGANARIQQEIGTTGTSGAPTDVNQSTVDPALRAMMLGTLPLTDGNAEALAAANNMGAASSISG